MNMILSEAPIIIINLGQFHLTVTLSQIIYLGIAALVGLVAEFIVGWRLPFGFIGAILAALAGVWLLSNVIQVVIPGDPNFYGVPLIKALIGATLLVTVWHLLTFGLWHRRPRYAQRRASS
jgi:uncharacterized membrane protein YeaQ/YmgE (transglycosylase-associated protein family)